MKSRRRERFSDSELLADVLDNLPVPVYLKDADLKTIYTNQAAVDQIGKPYEELVGVSDFDVFDKHIAEGFAAVDRHVLETGIVDTREEAITVSDTETHYILTRKARHTSETGEAYLVGTNSDETVVKLAHMRATALAETVPVALAQVRQDGTIAFANPLFRSYCGETPVDQAKAIADLAAKHTKFPHERCKFEGEIKTATGEELRLLVVCSGLLRIDADQPAAIISMIDITEMMELRRINNEISRLNQELAENMRMLKSAQDELIAKGKMEQLGRLTATVAHELRNPLGSVRTSAFLMERKLAGKDMGVEKQLERISNGVVRCDAIITQLLDFTRTSSITAAPADLDSWLEQLITEESRKLPASLNISVQLGLNSTFVPFDAARLSRAIINLVSNASEAMAQTGEAAGVQVPSISISTRIENDFAEIQVQDNGPGMTPEILQKIREPLFTTKSFGTGLGVPAVEQIALQHGGRLDIVSSPNNGACFTICLPLQNSESAAA